jgi:hypothetical protein
LSQPGGFRCILKSTVPAVSEESVVVYADDEEVLIAIVVKVRRGATDAESAAG